MDVLARNRECEHLTVDETLNDLVNATHCETSPSEDHKLTYVNRIVLGVRKLTFQKMKWIKMKILTRFSRKNIDRCHKKGKERKSYVNNK